MESEDRALIWRRGDAVHRDDDAPAIVHRDGTLEWWKNGKRHRDNDNPAFLTPHGRKEWYIDGRLHRENGPAIVMVDGTSRWYTYNRWRGMVCSTPDEWLGYQEVLKDQGRRSILTQEESDADINLSQDCMGILDEIKAQMTDAQYMSLCSLCMKMHNLCQNIRK